MNNFYLNKDLVQRFLNDDCTDSEIEFLIGLIQSNNGDDELEKILLQIWETNKKETDIPEVNFEHLLEKIHHAIISRQIDFNANAPLIVPVESKFKRIIKGISKIAAVLFIPLLFYTVFNVVKDVDTGFSTNMAYNEMSTPAGVKTIVTLPDGSKVWLNGGSKIRYPQNFTTAERLVEFTGEGYFQVVHNSSKPFIVNTDEINIKVLGTSFNIENYSDQEEIKTTLIEGQVELQRVMPDGATKVLTHLKPNQQLIFEKENNKGTLYNDVNTLKYTAWLDGKVIFENDPLDVVFRKLERVYNIKIDMNEANMSKYTFTATFENESIEQIIDLVKLAVPINYQIEDFKKNNDNSYTQKKYSIELKR